MSKGYRLKNMSSNGHMLGGERRELPNRIQLGTVGSGRHPPSSEVGHIAIGGHSKTPKRDSIHEAKDRAVRHQGGVGGHTKSHAASKYTDKCHPDWRECIERKGY